MPAEKHTPKDIYAPGTYTSEIKDGWCVYNPPTVCLTSENSNHTAWPQVHKGEQCGKFSQKVE